MSQRSSAGPVTTSGRERSFVTIMRSAAGYFEKAGKPNFTKDRAVKALFKELEDMIGTEPQPRTHCTRRMLCAALLHIARKHKNKPYLRVRETVVHAHGFWSQQAQSSG